MRSASNAGAAPCQGVAGVRVPVGTSVPVLGLLAHEHVESTAFPLGSTGKMPLPSPALLGQRFPRAHLVPPDEGLDVLDSGVPFKVLGLAPVLNGH